MKIPQNKGSYILFMKCDKEQTVKVGSLGHITLIQGYYLYCGSAFGGGGIASRVLRHLKPFKKHRWHVDYVRRFMSITDIYYKTDENMEHEWSSILLKKGGEIHLRKFGSSDCKCPAHLIYFKEKPESLLDGIKRIKIR